MDRVEKYWIELLDSQNQLIRTLDTVGGRINLNVNAPIRGGGRINVVDDNIDWLSTRVRCWYSSNDQEPFAIGTFLPTFPRYDRSDRLLKQSVDLHDTTKVLVDDKIEDTLTVPEGAVVTDAIRDILLSAGETAMSITPSDATMRSARNWEPGTTKLRVINDLLDYINYFSIWTDGQGVFQAIPYMRPASRPESFTFKKGKDAIHRADWSREDDISEVPNKVVLVTDGSEEEEALRGMYANTDPNSRFSYWARGERWIVFTDQVEAADQETIDDLARRRLISLSSPSATIEIEHAVIPQQLNNVVRFVSPPVDTLAVIERMQFTMTPGSLVTTTIREVQDL